MGDTKLFDGCGSSPEATGVRGGFVAFGNTDLGYLMLLSETRRGLPYSLWALPDQSELPGCLVWLVRHWGTRVYRSLSLNFGRYVT